MLQRAQTKADASAPCKGTTPMTIDVATGISRILKQEGVGWVSTFPVCRVNNALGREGVPMLMMRDDRYAVAVADAFSRITAGSKIGVCNFQGGVNAEAPPNWWTPLLSSEGSGKVSNGPGTASIYR